MTTELALVGEVVDEPTLEELAATANREHEAVVGAAEALIGHAIKAGEALLAARASCEKRHWGKWLETHFRGTPQHAARYMRVARYKEIVLAADLPRPSLNQAFRALRGLPDANSRGSGYPQALQDEGKRLHESGMPATRIADYLGVSPSTVGYWVDDARRLQSRKACEANRLRRIAEREALKRARRDSAVRKAGGPLADTYSFIRRGLQAADLAVGQATDREQRACINAAMAKMHGAEDEIVRALGVQ